MGLIIKSIDECWLNVYKELNIPNEITKDKNLCLCIDILEPEEGMNNILWLHESPGIIGHLADEILNKKEYYFPKFKKIYTGIEKLLDYPNVHFVHPSNGAWVEPKYLPTKTKNISMISSSKCGTLGHFIRVNLMNNLPKCVDLYGRHVNPIDSKNDALDSYRYSIAIENYNTDYYFSEKLLDCFLTCTIPIYWGPKFVNSTFNQKGIIWLDEVNDICNLDEKYYNDRIGVIKQNYEYALLHNVNPKNVMLKLINEN